MKRDLGKDQRHGFTLIEIIVVISIIGIFAAVGTISFQEVRADARDRVRIATVEQINLAMRIYLSEENTNLACSTGVKIDGSVVPVSLPSTGTCPDGGDILTYLESFFGSVPVDPLGPGSNNHYYYFDGNHICKVDGIDINPQPPFVFSVNLENTPSNQSDICDLPAEGNEGGYLRTTQFGGTITPSVPYVLRLK